MLLPGDWYGPQAPLLHYATLLLARRGRCVHRVEWPDPAPAAGEVGPLVRAVLDGLDDDRPLVVAKSLGTCAMPLAVQRRLPGIWLTPVLDREPVASAVTRLPGTSLLVGGTADPLWDPTVALRTDARVVEVTGGDHALEDPDDEAASLAMLTTAVRAMASFVDALDAR